MPDTPTMRCFTARASARQNTCLIASGSGSRPASSSCIQARHGLCIARTSIGPRITPNPVHIFQFTFLGYTFRPRKAVDKYDRVYVNFSPAVSRDALKAMRQTIRGWPLHRKSDKSMADRPDPAGGAAILWPLLRIGPQAGVAKRE